LLNGGDVVGGNPHYRSSGHPDELFQFLARVSDNDHRPWWVKMPWCGEVYFGNAVGFADETGRVDE
jgi:hypothetical protein